MGTPAEQVTPRDRLSIHKSSTSWTYSYDNFNRLISAVQTPGVGQLGSAGATVTWTYDRFGNRWSQSVTGQTAQQFTFYQRDKSPGPERGLLSGCRSLATFGFSKKGEVLKDGKVVSQAR